MNIRMVHRFEKNIHEGHEDHEGQPNVSLLFVIFVPFVDRWVTSAGRA
jgi:hypothetical protein